MIDIHAHILPGMDDGADDMQEALTRQKVTVNIPDEKKVITYTDENYAEKLAECIRLRNQGIAAELIPAR